MRTPVSFFVGLIFLLTTFSACNNETRKEEDSKSSVPAIKEENVSYTLDSVTMNGFVAFDSNATGKRPVVLIVHEWWGVNDYVRNRAKQLAEMGYVAMAVDMYGNGKQAADPKEALALAMPFYQNPQMAKNRLDAALNKVKEYGQADLSNVAAIGYCFGGAVVLNAARLGMDAKGVVSFHGSLLGAPANKDLMKAKVLVCHGGADNFIPQQEIDQFKKQMDSINADYSFITYDSATHAFTNPDATETGKKFNMPIEYNAGADRKSWADMKQFFDRIFVKNN
ncbi:MAG TPA: dienelactone hydrolase family protein [Chitinophagaceae bacterium]